MAMAFAHGQKERIPAVERQARGQIALGLTQQRDEKLHRLSRNMLFLLNNTSNWRSRFLLVFLAKKREFRNGLNRYTINELHKFL